MWVLVAMVGVWYSVVLCSGLCECVCVVVRVGVGVAVYVVVESDVSEVCIVCRCVRDLVCVWSYTVWAVLRSVSSVILSVALALEVLW